MAYDFSIDGSTLVVTLDTESGKFAPNIHTYSQPNLELGNDRIFLKEEGLFVQDFVFENIGDINGDTATNLIGAYNLLDSLIKGIFVVAEVGGVQSVSGDLVDNTDPLNPIINKGYKVYTALLTQSGTNAPVATVLENTLGNIVWSRVATGTYAANSSGAFTTDKTTLDFGVLDSGAVWPHGYVITSYGESITGSLKFYTGTPAGSVSDDMLVHTKVEIRVYN